MRQLWKNPDIVKVMAALAVLCAIVGLISALWIRKVYSEIHRSSISRDITILGSILSQYPEIEDDISGYFTQPVQHPAPKAGIIASERRGYSPDLPLRDHPGLHQVYSKHVLFTAAVFGALAVFSISVVAWYGRRLYANL